MQKTLHSEPNNTVKLNPKPCHIAPQVCTGFKYGTHVATRWGLVHCSNRCTFIATIAFLSRLGLFMIQMIKLKWGRSHRCHDSLLHDYKLMHLCLYTWNVSQSWQGCNHHTIYSVQLHSAFRTGFKPFASFVCNSIGDAAPGLKSESTAQ